MEINNELFEKTYYENVYRVLLKHFQYSIKDINSYDELTDGEQEIISKEVFDKIVK